MTWTACSETCYRRHKSAEQNPNWRGGVTAERKAAMSRIEYKDWRRAVFERDNYTCADCGKRGGDLEADHIKPWAYCPELRYTVSNGRTLCATCHHGRMWEVFTHRPGKDG